MDFPRSLGLEIRTTMQESYGSATYQVTDISVGEHRTLRVLTPRCTTSNMIFPCVSDPHAYVTLQCPSLACYYRVFQSSGPCIIYLTRELFKEPLGCLIQKYQDSCLNISEYTIIKIVKQILEGLRYLHEPNYRLATTRTPSRNTKHPGALCHMNELIHGRLHLNNVMLRWNGSIALCDMAYLFPNSVPYSSGKYSFAPDMSIFIAPEAVERAMWSAKSDMWSLGMIMYIMCTLQAPCDVTCDTFVNRLRGDPLLTRYSPQLCDVLFSLLSMTPDARPTACYLLQLPLFSKVKDTKIVLDDGNLLTTDTAIPFSDKTDLMNAASSGNYEAAMAHLDQCGLATVSGKTALMYASQNGHAKLIPLLISEAKLQIINRDSPAYGKTALMYAASKNHVDIVTQLVLTEARIQNGRGKTALMIAAENGHIQAMEQLIPHEKGIRTHKGLTALMLAVLRRKWLSVEMLLPLEKKAKTKCGSTALMIAAKHNIPEGVKYLLFLEGRMTRRNGRTALMIASAAGSVDFVAAMVDLSIADPSNTHLELRMRDKQGYTSLIHAARNGRAACMKLLLDLEQDILDNKKRSVISHFKYWVRRAKDPGDVQACMDLLIEKGLIKNDQHNNVDYNNQSLVTDMSAISMLNYNDREERSPKLSTVVLPNDELQDLVIFEVESSLDNSAIFLLEDESLNNFG